MTGFHQDESGDWVAALDCGHRQHIRHQPPFFNRPWAATAEGRRSKLGASLDCARCDRYEMPEGFQAYQRTKVFDESSIPKGLRRAHATKAGVWAQIQCLHGHLNYWVEAPVNRMFRLDPEHPGIVLPEIPHHVSPDGVVQFYVVFYQRPVPQR